MVGHLGNGQFWESLLSSLYDSMEGLDSTAYRVVETDHYTRARQRVSQAEHLSVWVDLGNATLPSRAGYNIDLTVHVMCRQFPDDDGRSVGVARAAASDVCELLAQSWSYQTCRATPTGYTVQDTNEPEWVQIAIAAVLYVPRNL